MRWRQAAGRRAVVAMPVDHETPVQRAVTRAVRESGLTDTPVATRCAQLGHRDLKTTMIYTHVLNRGGLGVRSPLDEG